MPYFPKRNYVYRISLPQNKVEDKIHTQDIHSYTTASSPQTKPLSSNFIALMTFNDFKMKLLLIIQ